MTKPNKLESAVLTKLLEGDHPILTLLRGQLPHLSVNHREHTGVGFFTEFTVSDDAPRLSIESDRLVFGDVEASIAGLEYGGGFVLYVEEGLLQTLEAYCYGDSWPEDVSEFRLRYSDPDRRELLAKLDEQVAPKG